MGVLLIGRRKDSFKRLYDELAKEFEKVALSLPSEYELKNRIGDALKEDEDVK